MRQLVCLGIAIVAGCAPDEEANADVRCDPFAVDVVSFSPGADAGFGAAALPGVIQGPPAGLGGGAGSTDVVSLGMGGRIVLELACPIVDGEDVDFVVYENAFKVGADHHFVDPARVAVSNDGSTFVGFACTAPLGNLGIDDGVDGCAGLATVAATADNGLAGVFPDGGGDGFDLATVGLAQASFIEIADLSTTGGGDSAGFDLDSVAVRVR